MFHCRKIEEADEMISKDAEGDPDSDGNGSDEDRGARYDEVDAMKDRGGHDGDDNAEDESDNGENGVGSGVDDDEVNEMKPVSMNMMTLPKVNMTVMVGMPMMIVTVVMMM